MDRRVQANAVLIPDRHHNPTQHVLDMLRALTHTSRMISSISTLCVIGVVLLLQNASPAPFVGTWTGYQSWATEGGPPDREPQPVTLTIELVDGKLVGAMTP